ncbi:T9SS type A sorting domain-containing protein [Halocola ammonii]
MKFHQSTFSFFTLFFTIVLSFSGFAQKEDTTSILAGFSLRQVDNHIQINFAIKGGSSCNGVELERSKNGLDFEVINFIPGICGGTDKTEYYTLSDNQPLANQENHYRLQLGQQERTFVLTIRFVPLEDGYRVFPNPASQFTLIRFNNPQELQHELYIFDARGLIVEKASNITSSEVYLNLQNYSPGKYFFTLAAQNGNGVKGKFIVTSQHD